MHIKDVNKKKHPIRNGIGKGLLLLLILLIGFSFYYVNDYYHASADAQALLVDTPQLSVIETEDDEIFFVPEDVDTDIGFIFYPGAKVEYTAYAPLLEACAKRGILCVISKMPGNMAILDVEAAASLKDRFPQIKHWYIGGHSMGGAAAGMYVGKHPGDFEGIILLAAYSTYDFTNEDVYPDFKALSIYGSEDLVLTMENYEKYKTNLPADFTEYVIEGGCHAFFGDYGAQKGDGTPTITREEQLAQTVEQIVRFFQE